MAFVVKSKVMSAATQNLLNASGATSSATSESATNGASPASVNGAPTSGGPGVHGSRQGAGTASSSSPTFSPLYQQIKSLITRSLQSGEWKPGEMIPSEVELAGRFKVSQGTVRKAIDELSAENLVVRRQGKGTFVATHHEARAQFRFLRLMPDAGEPHPADSRFLEVKRMRGPAEVARLLDIKSGDSVIFIKRVQAFDGAPTILEEIWLPGTLFKGLTAERLNEYKGPMYGLFETEFGTRMIRASEKIRASAADEAVSALLSVPVGTALLSVERVSFTYDDKPVEVRRGLYLTEHHHYQNELS
ncbi:MAG: GntR family transcriptional regulator [Herminiimonas sp.]|nr:GntR family transcriptional regulator [Herminiimonas sp.]MDB5855153.1 GntR family transcriptional regulator [Herminiimonas sp.]